jgi:hypothetical protein
MERFIDLTMKTEDNEKTVLTESSDHDWLTLKGVVSAVDRQSLLIRIEDGSEIAVTPQIMAICHG